MSQSLQMGANTVLNSPKGQVSISYEVSSQIDISLTAFLLTDSDQVQGDHGIIFYNQPESVSGVASLLPAEVTGQMKVHRLNFDMSKVPDGITKMAITLTEDQGSGFSQVKNIKATIHTGNDLLHLTPAQFTNEKGIVVVELYIRHGETKARSIWRGFDSGLEGLCRLYGVEVEAEEQIGTAAPEQMMTAAIEKETKDITPISLEKVQGKISLDKGQKPIIIEKTPEMTATVSWESGTDYDIYALVYTKSGQQIDVAMFGAQGTPPLKSYGNGAVEHMGDVGRDQQSMKTEVIKLRLNPDIVAVVPVVYSAQSNGTGSFYRYRVSMSIDNHRGTSVTIQAKHANDNDEIYSCVPGMLQHTNDGVIIRPLELYSKPNSERRPKLKMKSPDNIEVLMDKGPINDYK
ncbi:TerD family protein [Bacillus pumilus]|nr:TerD family protein [Bacillus pumilus]